MNWILLFMAMVWVVTIVVALRIGVTIYMVAKIEEPRQSIVLDNLDLTPELVTLVCLLVVSFVYFLG